MEIADSEDGRTVHPGLEPARSAPVGRDLPVSAAPRGRIHCALRDCACSLMCSQPLELVRRSGFRPYVEM